jgi:outer membrane beta-barrel protein
MRRTSILLPLLMSAALPLVAAAQTPPAAPPAAPNAANEQVIVPKVERREVPLPRIPSKDIEIGLFGGVYGTQNFGSNAVGGVRLGYHITEDIFVEAAYAQTSVSDEAFRQILPGGIFVDKNETLKYYNVSAGYNLLPGEVFFGRNSAKASAFYLIGGVGSTDFADQKKQTFNVGFGMRLLLGERFSVRVDARDHFFSLDLLGKSQNTQNLELTAGVSYFF